MSTTTIQTFTLGGHLGTEGIPVAVTCHAGDDALPGYSLRIEHLTTNQAKETSVRVRSALAAAMPERIAVGVDKVTMDASHFVPAILGSNKLTNTPALDLPVALAVLGVECPGVMVLGELGLDGSVRGVRGVYQACMLARSLGCTGILVPEANEREACAVLGSDGVKVHSIAHLRDARTCLARTCAWEMPPAPPSRPDASDVRGQGGALAITESAVVAHLAGQPSGLLLWGAPGTGKTMIARRIPSLMPALTRAEALDVTRYYSAVGMANGLVNERPFRAPHHTISTAALVGGGVSPRPGEAQLATHGVLFLDELTEFRLESIRALRTALEAMPAESRPMIVASTNPCPCGWMGSEVRSCTCTVPAINRHAERIKQFADALGLPAGVEHRRFPWLASVRPVTLAEMRSETAGDTSAQIRERVVARVELVRRGADVLQTIGAGKGTP